MTEEKAKGFFNIGDVVLVNGPSAVFIGHYMGRCPITSDVLLTHAFCWISYMISKTDLQYDISPIFIPYGEINSTGGDDFQTHALTIKKANTNEVNVYVTGKPYVFDKGPAIHLVQ